MFFTGNGFFCHRLPDFYRVFLCLVQDGAIRILRNCAENMGLCFSNFFTLTFLLVFLVPIY